MVRPFASQTVFSCYDWPFLDALVSQRPVQTGQGTAWKTLTKRLDGPRVGTFRVCGVKHALKTTEMYPERFCAEVAVRFAAHILRVQELIYCGSFFLAK